MVEVRIDVSELKSEGKGLIDELADFLEKRTSLEVDLAADEIIVISEGETVSRTHLRVLLRKFLHKEELKEYFRVIGGKESSLIIKEIKKTEEE